MSLKGEGIPFSSSPLLLHGMQLADLEEPSWSQKWRGSNKLDGAWAPGMWRQHTQMAYQNFHVREK